MNLMRHEDQRLITGTGQFTADWSLDGQKHAAVVRSDRAHAKILSIDLDAAREMPGVVLILTAADVEQSGFGNIPSAVWCSARPRCLCWQPTGFVSSVNPLPWSLPKLQWRPAMRPNR